MGPKIFQLHGFPNVEHSFTSQLITRLLIGSYNKTKILSFEIHGIFFAKLAVSHEVLLYTNHQTEYFEIIHILN